MDLGLSNRFERLVIGAVLLAYVILAAELARVRPPNFDDGNFGNAAAIFASKHYLAMPMKNNVWLPGLDKHLYANMPLYFLGLAAWFKMFGVGIVAMRLFSVFWGATALASWYIIARALSQDRLIALLSLVLIGLNYDYLDLTADRYDIMCAALSAAALAAYLSLRERRLDLALVVSNTLVAAAFMTHPYGLFGFVSLVLFVIALDVPRVRLKQLASSVVPYLVALASWGLYILRDPVAFRNQFIPNAAPRLPQASLFGPLKSEVIERYLVRAAGWRPDVPVYMRVKILVLLAILFGIIGCIVSAEIRRNRRYKMLLVLTGISFLMLTYLDPYKFYGYAIHIWPLYFVLLAIWLSTLMRRGRWHRYFAAASVALLALFTVVTVAYRVRLDSYHKAFLPALAFLEQHVTGEGLVMGPGEFGFGLGFQGHLVDDIELGYESGKRPEYIVIDKEYQEGQQLFANDAPLYAHIQRMISSYKLVFVSKAGYDFYRIYSDAP